MSSHPSICRAYAINIQDSQIRKVLTSDRHADPLAYKEERDAFYVWLVEQDVLGYNFPDQLYAWDAYRLWFSESVEDVETLSTDWLGDIEEAYTEKVNTWANLRNYTEVGRHSSYAQQ